MTDAYRGLPALASALHGWQRWMNEAAAAVNVTSNDGSVTAGASASPVPLPAAAWLFGSGLLLIFGLIRKRTLTPTPSMIS